MQTKTCRKCYLDFPTNNEFFYKNPGGKYGLTPRCKPCVNADNKESHARRFAQNPDKFKKQSNERSKRHYSKNLEASRKKHREAAAKARSDPEKRAMINMAKRAGGARLTIDDFNKLFESQNHCCAICGSTDPGAKHGWNIDHCHRSGEVRFILCAHCNRGLGAFFDNPDLMRKAATALEAYQNQPNQPVASIFE